jgi:hypothetical protein
MSSKPIQALHHQIYFFAAAVASQSLATLVPIISFPYYSLRFY